MTLVTQHQGPHTLQQNCFQKLINK